MDRPTTAVAHTTDVTRDFSDHYMPAVARVAYDVAQLAIEDARGTMPTNNGTEPAGDVERTFAGMLSELEDVATRLTVREHELARELQEVQAELQRVETVRTAMTGKAAKPKVPAYKAQASRGAEKVAKIKEWAKDRDGEWTTADAGEALGLSAQGLGPVLAGMVRRNEARVREVEDDGGTRRLYALT